MRYGYELSTDSVEALLGTAKECSKKCEPEADKLSNLWLPEEGGWTPTMRMVYVLREMEMWHHDTWKLIRYALYAYLFIGVCFLPRLLYCYYCCCCCLCRRGSGK